jgi:hypothetical protein
MFEKQHQAWLLRVLRKRAIKRQGNLCHWCTFEMEPPGNEPMSATAEHLTPIHAGGQTTAANIVAAHGKCNRERHPELNRTGGGLVASVGDDTPRSPFAVLGQSQ